MRIFKAAISAISLAVLALPAAGQSLSFGARLTTDYIGRGARQTTSGLAFQPWAEYESNGWYGGVWASNVDLAPDNVELDLYGGYRWSVNNTSLDVGYAHYFYDSTGSAGGELYVLGEFAMAGDLVLFSGMYLGFGGGVQVNEIHLGASTTLAQNLTGSARLGLTGGWIPYGEAGVSYAVNDHVSVDARYHSVIGQNGRVVVGTDFSF